jgi:hypothetical protein
VRYSLVQEILKVSFAITTSDIAPEDTVDDEIYNRNVVEVFICTTFSPGLTPRPYYEFEVSPYNQELQVLIDINGHFDEKWKTDQAASFLQCLPSSTAAPEFPSASLL